MNESLSVSLQENLLTLLCFDKTRAAVVVSNVTPELFESSYYREIAAKAINYYIAFKTPIAEHLPDELESVLTGKDIKKSGIYEQILHNLFEARESINGDYVLNQLSKFVRQQKLKLSIKEAIDFVNTGNLDSAEEALEKGRKNQLSLFNPGTRLTDTHKILAALDNITNYHHTGIDELDVIGICPAPKELFVIVALPGHGKSWFLTHIGKTLIRQRKKILHITLEMSEEKTCLRYIQSLFSIAKSEAKKEILVFKKDSLGRLASVEIEPIPDAITLNDPGIKKIIESKIKRLKKPQLIVKEFPTGTLTINGLKAYLDNLESYYNFVPDVLLVDYADLMMIDAANLRIDTGRVYKDLRGIAVERNISVVTASQANRSGEGIRILTREYLSEDFSKAMIADNIITFNQSETEYKKGVARLYVDKGRNDRKGDLIGIVQNYSRGQFCLQSVRIQDKEFKRIVTPEDLGKKKNNESSTDDN